MPLQLAFASVFFLFVCRFFLPFPPTYSQVYVLIFALFFLGGCVADQPAVPWLCGCDMSCLFDHRVC